MDRTTDKLVEVDEQVRQVSETDRYTNKNDRQERKEERFPGFQDSVQTTALIVNQSECDVDK